jgi:hypothetical protein
MNNTLAQQHYALCGSVHGSPAPHLYSGRHYSTRVHTVHPRLQGTLHYTTAVGTLWAQRSAVQSTVHSALAAVPSALQALGRAASTLHMHTVTIPVPVQIPCTGPSVLVLQSSI